MNDPYHWHAERMVDLEMQEIRREIAQANLLREAGLTGPSLLARGIQALGGWLKRRGEKPQARRAPKQEARQAFGDD